MGDLRQAEDSAEHAVARPSAIASGFTSIGSACCGWWRSCLIFASSCWRRWQSQTGQPLFVFLLESRMSAANWWVAAGNSTFLWPNCSEGRACTPFGSFPWCIADLWCSIGMESGSMDDSQTSYPILVQTSRCWSFSCQLSSLIIIILSGTSRWICQLFDFEGLYWFSQRFCQRCYSRVEVQCQRSLS